MSLIQDALKRREQESGKPVQFPDSPDLPPRTGQTPGGYILPPRPGKNTPWHVWMGIAASICVLLILLGAGVGFLVIAARSMMDKSTPTLPDQAPAADSGPSQPSPGQTPPVEQQEASKNEELPYPDRSIGAGLPRGNRVTSVQFSSSGWPHLAISGIMMRPVSADCSVVIDGAILYPGDHIAEVLVVEVRSSGVLLEHRGERQFVKVGRSTR